MKECMKIKLINLILFILILCPSYCNAANMVTYTYQDGTGIPENQEPDAKEIIEEPKQKPEVNQEQPKTIYVPVYQQNYNPYYYQYTYPGYVGVYNTNPNYFNNSGNFSFNYSGFGFSYGNTYYRNPKPPGGYYPPPPPPPHPPSHNGRPQNPQGSHSGPSHKPGE